MVALGIGLLIGVERERANREQAAPAAAGLRTFAISALAGAAAVLAGGVPLLLAITLLTGMFAALGYWRTETEQGPGLTSEVALVLTVLLGGLAVTAPGAAGSAGVVTALLLAGKDRLHRFAGSVLTGEELRSALILAAAAIVILPLLPNAPLGPFGAINPWKIWRLVVLVMAIGAAGYLAIRLLGPRFGLPISGLASGFVSSTATIGAMGAKAAKSPGVLIAAVAGAVLSTVATVVQMAVVLGATSQPTLQAMTPSLVAAGLAAAAYGAVFTLRALRAPPDDAAQAGDPFSLKTAVVFAATVALVMLLSAAASAWFGEAGAVAAGALAGFVDTHASAISIASLVANGRLSAADAVWPILAGFTTNTFSKLVLAFTAGGRAFAFRVAPGVVLVALAAWAGAIASRLWAVG